MGVFKNFKAGAKDMIKQSQARSKDNREYKNKLKSQVKEARRKAFLKEAVKQSQISARKKAQRVYNPTPQQKQQGIPNILLNPTGSQQTTPAKQRVIRHIAKKKSPKKKKKIITKRRVIRKIIQQKAPSPPTVDDLMRSLPQ